MSATGRSDARKHLDAYDTPQELVEYLVGLLPIEAESSVLEPSAGSGVWCLELIRTVPGIHVEACEIREECREALVDAVTVACVHIGDFLELPLGTFDLVIGNPPFCDAEEHIRHALSRVRSGGHVAMLLRLAFLESRGRVPFWSAWPARKVWALSECPSFTGKGTDSSAYGFFLWQKGYRGPTELEVVSWRA